MSLTNEQQAAVQGTVPLAKCMAAAGSGKTRVLAAKVQHLLGLGASPESICAITFTRKAAKEIEERCDSPISSGTFHSVILRRLQQLGHTITVLDEDEAGAVLDKVGIDLGMAAPNGWIKHSRKHYSKQIKAYREGHCESNTLIDTYLSRLAINGECDYDGLLVRGISLAKEGYFQDIHHLIVDEAQDCEPLQHEFIQAIVEQGANVMLVGDVAQCIYEWRGAAPQLLADLDWYTFTLSETFRCPGPIVDIANGLPVEGLEMVTNKSGGRVEKRHGDALLTIQGALKGRDPSEIAVLCRYNSQVESYVKRLSGLSIPVSQTQKVPRGPLWSLLKWLDTPSSVTARDSVTKKWKDVYGPAKPVLWAIGSMGSSSVNTLVKNWLSQFGSHATVGELLTAIAPPVHMMQEETYLREHHQSTLLSQLAVSEAGVNLTGSDVPGITGVCVDTIHSAKGLEWPVVIIPDLDTWPKGEAKQEDFRLFYVAVTRCMEDLFLLSGDEPGSLWEYC